jgi:hypothetical protein
MSYDASKFEKWIDRSKDKLVLKKDAPESAKKAFAEFQKSQKECAKKGIKS